MYCVYGNSSWYVHSGPLFGGGPLLGGSVIGGSTVYANAFTGRTRKGSFVTKRSVQYAKLW